MPPSKLIFARTILPILSERCFSCHGPDQKSRDAELRLDVRAKALGAGSSGRRAIVPGNAAASELVRRIKSDDPDAQMPPADSGKQLSPEQVRLIERWIQQGANWQEHWAFRSPVAPPLPPTKGSDWPEQPLDSFVLARLKSNGFASYGSSQQVRARPTPLLGSDRTSSHTRRRPPFCS